MPWIVFALFLVQNHTDFARGLERRGFPNLAESIYRAAGQDDLGLVEIRVKKLISEGDPAGAIREAAGWIDRNAAAPNLAEGIDLLAKAHRSIGRARIRDGEAAGADAAFVESILTCSRFVDEVQRRWRATPSEAVERQLMFAGYSLVRARTERIVALKLESSLFPALEEEFNRLDAQVTAYRWDFENYILSFVAAMSYGRAARNLAEGAAEHAPTRVDRYWKTCLNHVGLGKDLLQDPRLRGNPEIMEVGLRATAAEAAALIAYAQYLRVEAGPWRERLDAAVTSCRDVLSLLPAEKHSHYGIEVLLQQALAQLLTGAVNEAVAIVRDLSALGDDSVPPRIHQILGDHLQLFPVEVIWPIPESLFSRRHYYEALPLYQRIRARLGEEDVHLTRCWRRIGECYFFTNRPLEAATAFAQYLDRAGDAPEVMEIARKQHTSLKKVHALQMTDTSKERMEEHKAYLRKRGWLDRVDLRNDTIDLERAGKHEAAIEGWAKLALSGDPGQRVEALAQIGRNRLKAADGDREQVRKGIGELKAALDVAAGLDAIEPSMLNDLMMALHLGTHALARTLKRPREALEFSAMLDERFKDAPPEHRIFVLESRTRAYCMLDQALEAEKEFIRLKALYDRHEVGESSYRNARWQLVESLVRASQTERDATKAADLLQRVHQYVDGGQFHVAYWLANGTWTAATRSGNAADYARARTLYEQLLGSELEKIRAEGEGTEYTIRYRRVICLLREGKLTRANAACDRLMQRQSDLDLKELKWEIVAAEANTLQGRAQADRFSDAAEFIGEVNAAYDRLRRIDPDHTEAYYRTLTRWCETVFETTDGVTRLNRYFDTARMSGRAPNWDGGTWRDRLNAIETAVRSKAPK